MTSREAILVAVKNGAKGTQVVTDVALALQWRRNS